MGLSHSGEKEEEKKKPSSSLARELCNATKATCIYFTGLECTALQRIKAHIHLRSRCRLTDSPPFCRFPPRRLLVARLGAGPGAVRAIRFVSFVRSIDRSFIHSMDPPRAVPHAFRDPAPGRCCLSCQDSAWLIGRNPEQTKPSRVVDQSLRRVRCISGCASVESIKVSPIDRSRQGEKDGNGSDDDGVIIIIVVVVAYWHPKPEQ